MTWLYCVVEKTSDHCIVSCIVLFAKSVKTWNEAIFMCLDYWVVAMSWIMWSLVLILHIIVLSMTACSYMIRFNMYLESSVTGLSD